MAHSPGFTGPKQRLDGRWLHVGTPQAIAEAETAIAESVE